MKLEVTGNKKKEEKEPAKDGLENRVLWRDGESRQASTSYVLVFLCGIPEFTTPSSSREGGEAVSLARRVPGETLVPSF